MAAFSRPCARPPAPGVRQARLSWRCAGGRRLPPLAEAFWPLLAPAQIKFLAVNVRPPQAGAHTAHAATSRPARLRLRLRLAARHPHSGDVSDDVDDDLDQLRGACPGGRGRPDCPRLPGMLEPWRIRAESRCGFTWRQKIVSYESVGRALPVNGTPRDAA